MKSLKLLCKIFLQFYCGNYNYILLYTFIYLLSGNILKRYSVKFPTSRLRLQDFKTYPFPNIAPKSSLFGRLNYQRSYNKELVVSLFICISKCCLCNGLVMFRFRLFSYKSIHAVERLFLYCIIHVEENPRIFVDSCWSISINKMSIETQVHTQYWTMFCVKLLLIIWLSNIRMVMEMKLKICFYFYCSGKVRTYKISFLFKLIVSRTLSKLKLLFYKSVCI